MNELCPRNPSVAATKQNRQARMQAHLAAARRRHLSELAREHRPATAEDLELLAFEHGQNVSLADCEQALREATEASEPEAVDLQAGRELDAWLGTIARLHGGGGRRHQRNW